MLSRMSETIGEALRDAGEDRGTLQVALSHQIVTLLSEQLYQSPLKAIEELVVNSYDAEAKECRLALPSSETPAIAVWDNGIGMDRDGLSDLWHIGRSNKREEAIEKARSRKQIGKFGIGKLATYAIASRITYISRHADEILTTTLDYTSFQPSDTGQASPVDLPVAALTPEQFAQAEGLEKLLKTAGITLDQLKTGSWTLVLLEALKPKAVALTKGNLKWVLSTAMPLRADFKLFMDGDEIESSKLAYETIVSFKVSELPESRLKALAKSTKEQWTSRDGKLHAETTFPAGITGEVLVTRKSLFEGKSADLQRSHGFFVRVRDRLVNLGDPLFGLDPLSLGVFNRFRADIDADDLDEVVTAPREGIETTSVRREHFQLLLAELYYEARARFEKWERDLKNKQTTKREDERNYVMPNLVERPIADALIADAGRSAAGKDKEEPQTGSEADDGWFYLTQTEPNAVADLIKSLYSDQRSTKYSYERTQAGRSERVVRFDPSTSTFQINADHDFVRAYDPLPDAQPLLEDFATAEAMLEVYLRTNGVPAHTVGEVLERRDLLLRSLSKDRIFSLPAIAADLRLARDDEHDLEVLVVIAARALGFVAKHIGGGGNPDGIARFIDYPAGEQKIVLEAKSSADVPSLGAIDFGGLDQHMKDVEASGCLLVAPSYPGGKKEDDAAAAKRAINLKISCWTVEDLAKVVEQAEARQLNARDVLDIVRSAFTPIDVAAAVKRLLAEPDVERKALYAAVVDALRHFEERLSDTPRDVTMLAGWIVGQAGFATVTGSDVARAVRDIASASQGALLLRDDRLVINTSIDELERRVSTLIGRQAPARRASSFRST
jgi:hypothetical protein